jgi:hypothetical protein
MKRHQELGHWMEKERQRPWYESKQGVAFARDLALSNYQGLKARVCQRAVVDIVEHMVEACF